MADICSVCNEKIGWLDLCYPQEGIITHSKCVSVFEEDPERYGGLTTALIKEKIESERKNIEKIYPSQEGDLSKPVLKKRTEDAGLNGVYVRGFMMPFEEMVVFMVKWAIASIPAFIILFIIFGILFVIFGALFF